MHRSPFLQLEQQLGDNRNLKDELRHSRSETSNLERNMAEYELANRERDRLQDIVGQLEVCSVCEIDRRMHLVPLERTDDRSSRVEISR